MVVTPYSYTEELNFKPVNDRLPPCNIEAEEAVLGGILIDPGAIYRVKDTLRPEHFYIGAHRDIYQACLKVCKKGLPTGGSSGLLHVTSWLSDHDLLAKIGGRNKMATLVDRTVSAINIDGLAGLIIISAYRRKTITAANTLEHLAYDTQTEWTDVCVAFEKEFKTIFSAPIAPTKEENELWHYNQLIGELENIHRKTSNPGLKLYRLNTLANANPEIKGGVKGLEDLYIKSLCATVEKRKTLDELEQEVGTEGRKWLLGGILAQATTALVIADGGVGKTKWLYDLLHCIASGQNWNGFPASSDGRRVLIYQGDESKSDMIQALNKRGFKKDTVVRERTEVRFGWNTDAMPTLYEDAAEFRPAIVMIDSLTFANRYSLYDENRTEYSRPILELNKFASETGITVVIVHHTNKNGQSRGATAIRNAVSEVIKLEKDTIPGANPQEKILTIEKSRSRRFPASYRLFFNEEDFSFSLLEEVGQELGSSDLSTKDRIVKFLQERANVKFEAEEIAHHLNTTTGNARRCCLQLARDGIISLDEKTNSGTSKLYYIEWEFQNCSTETLLQSATVTSSQRITSENAESDCQTSNSSDNEDVYNFDGSPVITSMITLSDHLLNNSTVHTEKASSFNCNEGDHLSTSENVVFSNPESEEKIDTQTDNLITSLVTPTNNVDTASNPGIVTKAIAQGDRKVIQGDREVDQGSCDRLDDSSPVLHQPKLVELGFKEKDIIRITACPGRPELVGREETIERLADRTIRTGSGLHLMAGEFEKCSPSKTNPAFTVLQKGDICHCSLHNKQAKIQEIIVTKAEAKIVLAGDVEIIRVKLSDLTALTWKPEPGRPAMYGWELVTVNGYDSEKGEYEIETSIGRTYYVKPDKLGMPLVY
ncbi:AAA family ATPase [Nostoc sp.]|uniref:AAA family ATPase n=1 Tax=Nostoc sp. TaxID=1180 RepID=UPI002FFC0EDE